MNLTLLQDLAWDRDSLDPATVRVKLDSEALAELMTQRGRLHGIPSSGAYPALEAAIEAFRTERLDGYAGFLVIDGTALAPLMPDEKRAAFQLVNACLGSPLKQNANGDTLVEVFDRRTSSMASGGRYHQTNASGVLHTDSPQWLEVPDYVSLLCVRSAKSGGESKFISAYSVHNRMLARLPDLLEVLYEPFCFDKRGDFAAGEAPVTMAPVFELRDGQLSFRYLRDYINSGHRLVGEPLTARQTRALDALDETLRDETLVVSLAMRPDDLQVLNNRFIVHDRRPFEDYEAVEQRRLMLRSWLHRRS